LKPLREWDIDLKVLSEFKSSLISARKYFFEILLLDLFFIVLIILISKSFLITFILLTAVILFSFLILIRLGRIRNNELFKIQDIIKKITNGFLNKPEEIQLSESLSGIQAEMQKMFEKMKGDIEYLKKLERMRTEFLANVSHELRTPIFTIQGYVETLLDGALDDEKVNRNFLEKANHHTVNLSNLVNDLIDISMIESGEMRLSYRYFNINEYIANILKDFEPMAKEKNIELLYRSSRDNLEFLGIKTD
jgi:two-component system, OmpR family, phosphate regulon sensor histidine kinase PhoR